MSEKDVKNPPKARKQQFIRTYPEHDEILAEWEADLSPLVPLDRSKLIRTILELTRPFRAEAIQRLKEARK